MNRNPSTRNPKPETPNPETRNPKPWTQNPKPETRNPKPETSVGRRASLALPFRWPRERCEPIREFSCVRLSIVESFYRLSCTCYRRLSIRWLATSPSASARSRPARVCRTVGTRSSISARASKTVRPIVKALARFWTCTSFYCRCLSILLSFFFGRQRVIDVFVWDPDPSTLGQVC